VSTVDERISFLEAVRQFSKDYADIVNDPVLQSIAWAMDKQMMDAGDKRAYSDRYAHIGTMLRGKLKAWAEQHGSAQDAASLEGKRERKRAAPAAPPTAGAKSTATRSEQDDDGPDDETYIRQEAARRARHYGVQ
jgi:hypothetical protein